MGAGRKHANRICLFNAVSLGYLISQLPMVFANGENIYEHGCSTPYIPLGAAVELPKEMIFLKTTTKT